MNGSVRFENTVKYRGHRASEVESQVTLKSGTTNVRLVNVQVIFYTVLLLRFNVFKGYRKRVAAESGKT